MTEPMITEKIYSRWMAETQREKVSQLLRELRPKGTILDVGAGPGFLEEQLQAVATDIDLENLRKANGSKVLCSGDELPFRSKSFDWVFCIDTAHLLKGTDELERVSDGRIVLTAFCNENNFEQKIQQLRRMTKLKIEKELLIKTEKEWDAALVLRVMPKAGSG